MVEYIRVERGGQLVFVPSFPCPAGHLALAQSWAPCEECSYACVHWRCEDCAATVRDPEHVCRR